MTAVHDALAGLDADAQRRVITWAAARFQLEVAAPATSSAAGDDATAHAGADTPRFADAADLVHVAQPTGGAEQALVVAYWLQRMDGRDGWTGAQLNSELKNLGYAQANITATLTRLSRRKPSLVMQTSKAGRAQQARKIYKLTAAGIRTVEQMLGGPRTEEE